MPSKFRITDYETFPNGNLKLDSYSWHDATWLEAHHCLLMPNQAFRLGLILIGAAIKGWVQARLGRRIRENA